MYNKEIKKFLMNSDGSLKKDFPLILNRLEDEDWVSDIHQASGKKLAQKIYNIYHDIKSVPICENCGANLKFINFKQGYSKDCKSCHKQTLNSNTVSSIDTSKITPGHPKILSKEENFEDNTCSSSIVTTSAAQDEVSVLKEHGFNPLEWRITKMKHSMWDNGVRDLYASSIQVAKRNFGDLPEKEMFDRINDAVHYKPSKLPIYPEIRGDKKVLIVPIADFHYGLLCDEETTGNVYNMDIAADRMSNFISAVVNKYKNETIDELIVTFGNDYFNADNLVGTTTKGTPQDNEGPYFNIFDSGVQLAIGVVEALRVLAPKVFVLSVQANHDKQTSHALIAALYYKYHGDKQVQVDMKSDKSARYYLRRGKCLFGFGHETKLKDCAKNMTTESKDWSFTSYRTFFIAHLHHEESKDIGGITVRRLPTMCGKSEWTNACGYTDATAHAQTFLFSTERGLLDLQNVELD